MYAIPLNIFKKCQILLTKAKKQKQKTKANTSHSDKPKQWKHLKLTTIYLQEVTDHNRLLDMLF